MAVSRGEDGTSRSAVSRCSDACSVKDGITEESVFNRPVIDLAEVAQLCRHGLSPRTRPLAWKIMMGYYTNVRSEWEQTESESVQNYLDIASTVCDANTDARSEEERTLVRTITVDVPRTITTLPFFSEGGYARRKRDAAALSQCTDKMVSATADDSDSKHPRRSHLVHDGETEGVQEELLEQLPEHSGTTSSRGTHGKANSRDRSNSNSSSNSSSRGSSSSSTARSVGQRAPARPSERASASVVSTNSAETAKEPLHTHTQQSLWRILYTIATLNKGLGYVQGMNELAGYIMYVFCHGNVTELDTRVEASAFFCTQTLIVFLGDDYCRALDSDHTTGVISTLRYCDNVLQFFDPSLFDHLTKLGICSAHYALRWITLLFTHEFGVDDALRVWDFLLSFGDELPNLTVLIAAAMCHVQRARILETTSLEYVMLLLLNYPPNQVHDVLRVTCRWLTRVGVQFIVTLKHATREDIARMRAERMGSPLNAALLAVHGTMKSSLRSLFNTK